MTLSSDMLFFAVVVAGILAIFNAIVLFASRRHDSRPSFRSQVAQDIATLRELMDAAAEQARANRR